MLNRKKYQKLQGFTWIELLVVMAIVGILAASVLQSLLNMANFKCDSGVQEHVGTLARAQQAYFLEEKHFSSSIVELIRPRPVPLDMKNYTYSIENNRTKTFVFGKSQKPALKSYVAGVFINPHERNTSTAIICAARNPGIKPIAPPIDANTCGAGTSYIKMR
jgi:prepilin-type N-terminal cleavage/methylation domain-containing protein